MKRLIVLAIILLWAGCVSLLWAGQTGAGEMSPSPPPTRAIPKAIKPPELLGFKIISGNDWWYPSVNPDCPWKLSPAFTIDEAEQMLNLGWEYFAMGKNGSIIMKKRVCE